MAREDNPMALVDDELSDIHRRGSTKFDEALDRIKGEYRQERREVEGFVEG